MKCLDMTPFWALTMINMKWTLQITLMKCHLLMYLMSLKVQNIVVFCCQCTNNCRRKMILFHFRWWVRVALKRKVATWTNINPIHCSTFHVKYLHGIRCANPPWNSMEYLWRYFTWVTMVVSFQWIRLCKFCFLQTLTHERAFQICLRNSS